VIVRAADHEQAAIEIDVALLETEELALPEARVQRGGDERTVGCAELGEKPRHLLPLQECWLPRGVDWRCIS
jgi:hypothetical protein